MPGPLLSDSFSSHRRWLPTARPGPRFAAALVVSVFLYQSLYRSGDFGFGSAGGLRNGSRHMPAQLQVLGVTETPSSAGSSTTSAFSTSTTSASSTPTTSASSTSTTSAGNAAPPPTVYVCFGDSGSRLGNRLFQYAGTLGLASRRGRPLALLVQNPTVRQQLDGMLAMFKMSAWPIVTSLPPATAVLREILHLRYDPGLDNDTAYAKPVAIDAYLQSWRYFYTIADRIRREFDLTPKFAEAVASFFKASGLLGALTVGVHVRRGDMVGQDFRFSVASEAYMSSAVNYYLSKYGSAANLTFVFASDDMPWVKRVVKEHLPANISVRYSSFDTNTDLAILSRCNHSIITCGTFGWWSAWLAGGDVVYFKDFISPARLYKEFTAADYYPPTWIGM